MLAERVFVCGIALGVHNLKAFIESNSNDKIEEVGTDLVSTSTLEPWSWELEAIKVGVCLEHELRLWPRELCP